MIEGCKVNKCLEKRKGKQDGMEQSGVLGKGKLGNADCSMKWCDFPLDHLGIQKFHNDVAW